MVTLVTKKQCLTIPKVCEDAASLFTAAPTFSGTDWLLRQEEDITLPGSAPLVQRHDHVVRGRRQTNETWLPSCLCYL